MNWETVPHEAGIGGAATALSALICEPARVRGSEAVCCLASGWPGAVWRWPGG